MLATRLATRAHTPDDESDSIFHRSLVLLAALRLAPCRGLPVHAAAKLEYAILSIMAEVALLFCFLELKIRDFQYFYKINDFAV